MSNENYTPPAHIQAEIDRMVARATVGASAGRETSVNRVGSPEPSIRVHEDGTIEGEVDRAYEMAGADRIPYGDGQADPVLALKQMQAEIVRRADLLQEKIFDRKTGKETGYNIPVGSEERRKAELEIKQLIQTFEYQSGVAKRLAEQRKADAERAQQARAEKLAHEEALNRRAREIVDEEEAKRRAQQILGARQILEGGRQ